MAIDVSGVSLFGFDGITLFYNNIMSRKYLARIIGQSRYAHGAERVKTIPDIHTCTRCLTLYVYMYKHLWCTVYIQLHLHVHVHHTCSCQLSRFCRDFPVFWLLSRLKSSFPVFFYPHWKCTNQCPELVDTLQHSQDTFSNTRAFTINCFVSSYVHFDLLSMWETPQKCAWALWV